MNKIILIGNVTKDPELSTTASGVTVARFSLAVNRPYKKDGETETDFLNVVAWRQLGETCGKYLKKGNKAAITGAVQTRTYDAQDGTKRYVTEVIADSVEFLTPKKDGEAKDAVTTATDSAARPDADLLF